MHKTLLTLALFLTPFISSAAATTTTADFFALAVVPNQTVSNLMFEVQVVAENIDPNTVPFPPYVVDDNGSSFPMTFKTLKWPSTIVDSITVYSKTIQLNPDKANNLKVVSGAKEIPFSIRHKTTLVTQTATSSADFVAKLKAALTNPSVDVIQIDYDEPDLGAVFHYVGGGATNNRSTWLTITPMLGRSVSWNRDSGTPMRRPIVSMVHLDGVIFGSDTSDGGGGHFYTERNDQIWLSRVQFRGKYKYTWGKDTPMTANTQQDIRSLFNEGQKIYFTDCLWDGTASIVATTNAELARDLVFNSHRGDYNNFGKVFLNSLARDAVTVRNASSTDWLHNDGFQIWGNTGTSNLIFKGFKVVSPNAAAALQPFLLDGALTPNYSNVLVDTVIIEGSSKVVSYNAQFAGVISNSRFSNLTFDQPITFRQDFNGPNSVFSPTNVFIDNLNIKRVLYVAPVGGTGATYYYGNVANPNDISGELTALPSLAGVTFSNIKVENPTEGTFSPYQVAASNYRTTTAGGVFVNTIGLTGLTAVDAYANTTFPGLMLSFSSTANRDIYLNDARRVQLTVTVVNQGAGLAPGGQYVYTWARPTVGTSGIWTSTGAILRAANLETGSSPWPNQSDLWGSYATYSFKFLPTPDTTPPTISITNPTNGSTGSTESITITTSASDNVGVAGVTFRIDGITIGAEDTTAPYSLTTTLTSGTHTITATARDQAGNTTTATVTYTSTYTPPVVPTPCTENWSCQPWSTCAAGLQARTCSDASNCGTTVSQPALSQSCTMPSTPAPAPAPAPSSGGGGGGYSAAPAPTPTVTTPTPVTTNTTTPAPTITTALKLATTTKPLFTRTLSLGMKGTDVKLLQTLLAKDKTLYPERLTTGYFGPATKRAVQRFQDRYKLVTPALKKTKNYGAVGPKTRDKMREVWGR